ncbi:unnamed protein product [Mycena citricolor]|uniref:Hydroxyneurosporene synthase n=1 Tax=Mycena citricolor TaxID=2018698 RepID=A0AAD2Q3E2_9AGAR|nr:unnamed protein product [Mycena citricolor]
MVNLLALGLATLFPALVSCTREPVQISSLAQDAPSVARFTSESSGLDAPMVSSINGSSFDWWYFDVVSTEDAQPNSSVVVTFFTSSQAAFPLLGPAPNGNVLPVYLWVNYPDGTEQTIITYATGAAVSAEGDHANGVWEGTGFSFTGIGKGGKYVVEIDAPELGVKGSISFQPRAPAHYPCGPVKAGQNLQVGPHIGWSNAIPDAKSKVHLVNWSDQPFTTEVASWYWGHGQVGDYSIVWFDFLDTSGAEFVSAYASRLGKVVSESCVLGSISVRPSGANATYPPTISTPNPTGYAITLPIKGGDVLKVDVSVTQQLIGANPLYMRSVGTMSGVVHTKHGKKKGGNMSGIALFEQFKLTQ